MLKLYYAPGSCAFVPHAGLEIIKSITGQPFELQMLKLHKGEHQSEEFLAINPNAQVPLLVVDGQPLSQLPVICDYLDRRFPQAAMLPTDPWARAQALSQLAFMNSTAQPAFAHFFMPHKFGQGDEVHAELKRFNVPLFRKHLERIEQWVTDASPFWFGVRPGFHDAYALVLMRWAGYAGIKPESLPVLWAHVQRVAADPAVKAAMTTERLELNTYKEPAA